MVPRPKWYAILGVLASVAIPSAAAAQSCAPSYQETAGAALAQLGELGGPPAYINNWVTQLQAGTTVRQMVGATVHDGAYWERFVIQRDSSGAPTMRDSHAILTDLYRHILARDPDDNAWGLLSIPQAQGDAGWHTIMDTLINSAEYTARFGDHVVPGSPIVAWDCARASFTAPASSSTFKDATQGSSAVSYTTPAYVTLDQPRALTFAYSYGTARPTGMVQVNLIDNSGDAPDSASIRLKLLGSWVTDEVFFRTGAGSNRLAARYEAGYLPSTSLPITVVVRSYWRDGRAPREQVIETRSPVVNERDSPFGAGWSLMGFQRLTDQADGVFITEGGAGLWFERIGACGTDGICRYTSPAGDFSTVTYNGFTFDRRYPDGSSVKFALSGRMLEQRDRFGNTTTYGYDGSGRLTSITDPIGKVTTLAYTEAGALAWVEDPMGRRVTTGSSNNALYRFSEPDSAVALDMHLVQDGTGSWALDTYWNEAAPRASGLDKGTHFDYDAHGLVAAVTAPLVPVTETGVGQNVNMRPVASLRSLEMAVLAPSGTGAVGNPAPRVRPENVRVEATDARGNTTRQAVDAFGLPTRTEEPLGLVTTITRDRNGRVMRTVTPSGQVLRAEYRGVELRLTENVTTGAVVEMQYEPVFHQLTHLSGTGSTEVWNHYDALDPQRKPQWTRTRSATAPITTYAFNNRGQVESVTDPEGHGTFFQYVTLASASTPYLSWNTASVSTGSASTSFRRTSYFQYDAFGRPVLAISPGNDTTRTEYNLRNRTTRTIGAGNDTTNLAYLNGSLYSVRDAKGQFYHYHRDRLGRLASEVDPRGQYTYYEYDRASNSTRATNRRGQVITAEYDALNRQTSTTTVADSQQTTHAYGPNGAWVQSANAESVVRTVFDVAGRAGQVETTLGGVTYTQVNTFNAIGQRTQMRLTSSLAGSSTDSIGYSYDTVGRLATIKDFSGQVTLLEYNDDGQEERRGLPNGETIEHGYSSTHGTSSVHSNTVALSRDYAINANGRVGAMHRIYNNGGTDHGRLIRNYTYNRQGFVTFVQNVRVEDGLSTCVANGQDYTPDGGVCSPVGYTELLGEDYYTYDRVGNRTDHGATVEPGNRLMALNGYQTTYDADGNLTRKWQPGVDDVALTWNSRGQVVAGQRYQRGSFAYGYDPLGRRVRRTGTNGAITYYLYDGDDLLLEANASGARIRQYTHSPGVDQPLSLHMGGATYYYGSEEPGHVTGLLNTANQLVNRYRYTPWGELEEITEGATQPLRYMAREWDDDLGMYQVRARWYDPQLGRFVSEDPIGLAGGINSYTYVGNSPVNATDPSGLCYRNGWGWTIDPASGEVVSSGACNASESDISLDGLTDMLAQMRGGFGGGVIFSGVASAEGGLGILGGGATGSVGAGVFAGSDCGASVGVHATGGAFVGGAGGPGTVGYPGGVTAAGEGYHFAVGLAAGKGGSVTYTNATSMGQMRGPFENFTISTIVGGATVSWGSAASGKPISALTISGPSLGFAISHYATNTKAATVVGVGSGAAACQ